MVITDTLDLSPRYGHVVSETSDAVRSCISQPLRGPDGKIIGSLGMLWATPREFDPAELDWAAQLAKITQSTVDRIRNVQREHRIAVDFQDHLLDLDHGSTTAVVAAVYQPGGEAMRVGGDWYLVVPLKKPGQIAISVGDVVGHGLPAAIAMSRLRAGVAASTLTDADPGTLLATLDRYAATVPGARCATVSYAVIDDGSDPDTGDGIARISYSCAGHPYPLLVTPDQPPVFLSDGRRPPVAAWESPLKPNTAVHELPPGSVILMYTDGLIERPGEGLDHGFARLQGAAAYRADLPVGELCDELLERMAPPGGYTDDVVLLALRPCHSSPRSFATVVPASLDQIADARHRLREWLSGIDVDPRRESDILLATGEAVTNAVEHGSGGDAEHDGVDRSVRPRPDHHRDGQRRRSMVGRFVGQPARPGTRSRAHHDQRPRRRRADCSYRGRHPSHHDVRPCGAAAVRSGGRPRDMSRAEFQLQTHHGGSTPAEVVVTGEVDASNVVEFTRSVRELSGARPDHPSAEQCQVPGQCRVLSPGSTARRGRDRHRVGAGQLHVPGGGADVHADSSRCEGCAQIAAQRRRLKPDRYSASSMASPSSSRSLLWWLLANR